MELKYLDSFKCYQILIDCGGFPLGGGRWVDGGGGGYGYVGGCPIHAHTHAHTCMLNMINMDASMSAAICNFYTCIHMHVCVCVHVCVCACMWGHPLCPQMPPDTPTHLPPPQSRREPKTPNFNNS